MAARPFTRGVGRLLWLLAVACPFVIAGSSLIGRQWISWDDIAGSSPGGIYWQLRAPRAALAATAGAGLAISGVLLQALFRNPLAAPYTLGVASGASLGAACGFLFGIGGFWLWLPRLSVLAFVGAIGAMALVYLMSRLRAGRDMTRLLLAGVCISYMCSAGVMAATHIADRAVTNEIVIWLMGSLTQLRPLAWVEVAVLLVPVLAYGCVSHRAVDLLAMGDDLAATRGVAVPRTIWTCFILVGALTAIIVANCGPIAFVGLMVPHMARAMLGPRTLPLLIGSALIGAMFLAVCDSIARTITFPYELPVGVMTNILGAAFFFYLLATRDLSNAPGR